MSWTCWPRRLAWSCGRGGPEERPMDEDHEDEVLRRVNDSLYPPLTPAEQSLLDVCEEEIAKGLRQFLLVGGALLTIRARRLYRTRFKTFEEYCQTRWDFTPRRAY